MPVRIREQEVEQENLEQHLNTKRHGFTIFDAALQLFSSAFNIHLSNTLCSMNDEEKLTVCTTMMAT